MGKIVSINISEKKGLQKHEVDFVNVIEDFGIEGDAHAGKWHRQISFLDKEDIDEFNKKGANVISGAFGENFVVKDINTKALSVGSYIKCSDVLFEVTQKGKSCHDHCEIFYRVGECIMPKCGTFAKVLHGGMIKKGDEIMVIDRDKPFPFQAAVITLSDKGFKGEREDISGPTLVSKLKELGYEVPEYILLPDNKALLKKELIRLADERQIDLILTTGGTGFSIRDITPDATLEVMDRNAPGIAEAIRYESLKFTKHAMLSRGVSVIRKKALIINFPGSPKACLESLDVIKEALPHAIKLLRDEVSECARKD